MIARLPVLAACMALMDATPVEFTRGMVIKKYRFKASVLVV